MDKTEYLGLNKFNDSDIPTKDFINENFDKIVTALYNMIVERGGVI